MFESPLGKVALGERAVKTFKEAQSFVVLVDCYADRAVWEERLAKRPAPAHKPRSASMILQHYGESIEYELNTDAHVRIDTAIPTEDSVMKVTAVIRQLFIDEGSDFSPRSMNSTSARV